MCGVALFVIGLLVVCSLLKAWINSYQFKYFQETAFTVVVGIAAGGVLVLTGRMEMIVGMQDSFANLFFVVLLAPIIFESAFTLRKVVGCAP